MRSPNSAYMEWRIRPGRRQCWLASRIELCNDGGQPYEDAERHHGPKPHEPPPS